jgi:hypothetical protein
MIPKLELQNRPRQQCDRRLRVHGLDSHRLVRTRGIDLCGRAVRTALGVCLLLIAVASPQKSPAQGIASGNRTAARAKALPEGAALPGVSYVDIAAQAGLTGVNVSGSLSNATYIVEATGTGVAIFDFDLDGLQDIFFVNADRFGEERGKALNVTVQAAETFPQPSRFHFLVRLF